MYYDVYHPLERRRRLLYRYNAERKQWEFWRGDFWARSVYPPETSATTIRRYGKVVSYSRTWAEPNEDAP